MSVLSDYLAELNMDVTETDKYVDFDKYVDKVTFLEIFNIRDNPVPILIPIGQRFFAMMTVKNAENNAIEKKGKIGYAVNSVDRIRVFPTRESAEEHLDSLVMLDAIDMAKR